MKETSPRILGKEFKAVLDQLENTREHYFVTGRAGTGKSTLLSLFYKTTHKQTVIVAPTGIAALNVGGQTIHSFFRFPPRMLQPEDIKKLKNHWLYKKLEVLIIDEISMVRADMLDNIDRFLRVNREINLPFGGVQLICFGDLFQLPPVISSGFERSYFKTQYSSAYFFSSKVVENQWIDLKMIELHKVYRQTEKYFVKLLDRIRTRTFDQEDLDMLNEPRASEEDHDKLIICLCSLNATAKELNQTELNALETSSHFFQAAVSGSFNSRLYPTNEVLEVKEGAQVMFVKNDPGKRFVNGSLGKVLRIDQGVIFIEILEAEQTRVIELEKMDWEILRYKLDSERDDRFTTEIVGSFTQFPIKPAWAITIHKSQGKTFDNIKIDLGKGAFEFGQTYVALSRCRTLNGIQLLNKIRPRDIMVDPMIVDFYETKSRYW